MPGLEMVQIRKSFAGVEVLHGIDFDMAVGEVHALVGENGAGKSTLMKVLAGDVIPDSGTISFDGVPVEFRSPADSQSAGVAMIHQELSYVPQLTVAENLFLGRLPRRRLRLVDRRKLAIDAKSLLEEAEVDIDPTSPMIALTLGTRQIVEIMRAVSRNAKVIAMDEPTSSLNSSEVQTLFRIVDRLRKAGVSIIYISHHLDEVFSVADRVTVLRDGLKVSTNAVSAVTHESLVADMVGATVGAAASHREAGPTSTEVRLSVSDLTLDGAFEGVNLEVHRGEIVGLYGLAGAGQQEFGRTLYGLEPTYSGRVTVDGTAVSLRSPAGAVRSGIGFVPGDRKIEGIIPLRQVRENITYPSLPQLSRFGVVRRREEERVVTRTADRLRIKASPMQPIGSLSGGNQQKAVVARWFARQVKVLVLIDPTRGVDVRSKMEIHQVVRELAESGVSIVVISSDLPEVKEMCDRVMVLRRGRMERVLEASQVSEEEILLVAAGGRKRQ